MALEVEGVVDGGMGREEFLRGAGALEPLHLAFPPPRRLMRILGSVVLPSPALMVFPPLLREKPMKRAAARISRRLFVAEKRGA